MFPECCHDWVRGGAAYQPTLYAPLCIEPVPQYMAGATIMMPTTPKVWCGYHTSG